MKRVITVVLLFAASFTTFAQEESSEKKGSFSLSMNQDMFFGLYPIAAGAYPLANNIDFTYYGIMWNNLSWSEFGVGANFKVLDGKLGINPQVGVLSGSLLSRSDRPIFGEGIVPNLTANLGTDKVEGQLYFGYYLPLGKSNSLPSGVDPRSYTHYWTYAGYKASSLVSFGAHFEQLNQVTGAVNAEGEKVNNVNLYTWVGPYVAFSLSNGSVLKMTAGGNISNDDLRVAQDGFYKMQYIYNF